MNPTRVPHKSAHNYYGMGTYLGLAGALLAMIILFSSLSEHFFSYDTLSTLANQIPDLMVLSVGMTFVLIIGGIDLSVGSVLALAASTVSVAILGWGWSILRGEVGEVFASDGDQVPNDVLFRTGGAGSVRGYAYQSLGVEEGGAVLGGRVLGVASAEYLYPVTPKWAAAVFVDAGNAARRWQDFRFAVGYGVGARWASPVGPLGLDLAYGVDARQARLHFTLDVSF